MRPEPLRIYLKTSASQFLRFLWFHEYTENEMMLGVNGLASTVSVLDYIFPDRFLTNDDLRELRFDYSNLSSIHEQVDHITCHADGTFHIRTKNGNEVYRDTVKRQEPLGINTKSFLDFIVISDLARKYTNGTSKPESPRYVLGCNDNEFYVIKGKFSGARFPVESEMASELFPFVGQGQLFLLSGKTLKGVLFPSKVLGRNGMFSKRPRGTLLIFKFPQHGKYMIKGFVFS